MPVEVETPGGRTTPYSVPNAPDPTERTTQVLLRESFMLRELIETRLNAMDKAILLLQAKIDREPQLSAVVAKMEERFASIDKQFVERDVRVGQAQDASVTAVNAALQAAKEAVAEQNKNNNEAFGKSEAGFTKQIDNIILLVQAQAKGMDEKIDDLKNRIVSIESVKAGGESSWTWVVIVVGIALATLFVVFKGGGA